MILTGTTGDDTIVDGILRDRITGLAGADIFALRRDGKRDFILDFKNGSDKIDLTEYNVTWEEVFVRLKSPGHFIFEIRGEKTDVFFQVPDLGQPGLSFFSLDESDFAFAPGAAAPTIHLVPDTAASDVLWGTGRPDAYLLNSDGLKDVIRNYEDDKDVIDLLDFNTSFGELVLVDRSPGRVLIWCEGEAILVRDASHLLTAADFSATDFIL